MLLGMKIAAAMGLVMAVGLAGFYWYYKDTQQRLADYQTQIVAYDVKFEEQNNTIATLQADGAEQSRIITDVSRKFEEARAQVQRLDEKFNKVTEAGARDLGVIGLSKPRVLSKVITKASNNAARCFELLSGSEHTEAELNVSTRGGMNNECPEIANPNFAP